MWRMTSKAWNSANWQQIAGRWNFRKQLLPPTGYGLVHQGHFIPFWTDAFHDAFRGPTLEFARPWQEVASKLGCHLDVTTRAFADCLPHGAKQMHLVPEEAEVQEELEEVEPLAAEAHWKIDAGFWGQALTVQFRRVSVNKVVCH